MGAYIGDGAVEGRFGCCVLRAEEPVHGAGTDVSGSLSCKLRIRILDRMATTQSPHGSLRRHD